MNCVLCFDFIFDGIPHLCLPMNCRKCMKLKDNIFEDFCFECVSSEYCFYCPQQTCCIMDGRQYCLDHLLLICQTKEPSENVEKLEKQKKYEQELSAYTTIIDKQRKRIRKSRRILSKRLASSPNSIAKTNASVYNDSLYKAYDSIKKKYSISK